MVDKIQNISYDLQAYNNYVDFPIATGTFIP